MRHWVLLIALALVPATADAQPIWVAISGGYMSQDSAFEDVATRTEYLEPARITSTYESTGGPMIDVAAGIGLGRRVFLIGGAGVALGSSEILMRGEVPHPFFFGQPRASEHIVTNAHRREVALRAEVAWTAQLLRRLQMTVSGGPVAIQVQQTLTDGVTITEAGYPFDEVNIAPADLSTTSAWGLGGTVAGSVAWLANERIALMLTARFSRAEVTLRGHDADAGGASAVAGIRLRIR